MLLSFTKMQGAGNDFVVIDATQNPFGLSPAQLRRLGDRRFGVGCDQILVIEPADAPDIDFRYRIFNGADGAEVEHCGNGARCFARYCVDKGLTQQRELRVRTLNKVLTLSLAEDGRVRVDMGAPVFDPAQVPFLPQSHPLLEGVSVLSMGNPHAVFRVADVETAPVQRLGPQVQALPAFPQGVNVGFVQVQGRDRASLRVYERGAGETLACGTGACAAVVAGIRAGWFDRTVEVQARGGLLRIEWNGEPRGAVFMTGPAQTVFDGTIEL
jgi:diaminopimelate epimerase